MKVIEAERLLGGHATGTLTEEERRTLFAAALEHQEIFDALMDEEALRELLADPAAKAQLLAALASPAAKVVPFWRRTGVLGAAAGLIVAATAGLAYLRSPGIPLPERREKALEAAPETAPGAPLPAAEAPARPPQRSLVASPKDAPSRPAKEEAVAPRQDRVQELPAAQDRALAPAPAPLMDASAERAKSDDSRPEAAGNLAKAAEAKKKVAEPVLRPAGVPGGVPGGVIGGVVGGVVRGARSDASAPTPARAPTRAPAAPAAAAVEVVTEAPVPAWTLEPRADGTTRVRISAAAEAHPVLLWRKAGGVEVVKLRVGTQRGSRTDWVGQVPVAAGEALDLYLLNAPPVDPARLPATGHVDGFRARIYPPAKKEPSP